MEERRDCSRRCLQLPSCVFWGSRGQLTQQQHWLQEEQTRSGVIWCSTLLLLSVFLLTYPSREFKENGKGKWRESFLKLCMRYMHLVLTKDLGGVKNISRVGFCECITRFFSLGGSGHKTLPQSWLSSWLGILLSGEMEQGCKAEGKILLRPWQKIKAKQQLGLSEWWLPYLQSWWLCVFRAHKNVWPVFFCCATAEFPF